MLASTSSAGFSSAGPVSAFVSVASQMSRPSNDVPMLSTRASRGRSSAHPWTSEVSSSWE
jgi:hypothetical protein